MHESGKCKWSPSVVSDSYRPHGLQPTMLLHPWDFPGKSTGEDLHWLPGGSDGKTSVYNAGDLGSIPGSGRSPGEGKGNQLQYSCLENPMDRGAWCPWGRKESDTTEWLHFHFQRFVKSSHVVVNIYWVPTICQVLCQGCVLFHWIFTIILSNYFHCYLSFTNAGTETQKLWAV